MAAMALFRLLPRAGFHFGQRGVGIEATDLVCPADTLFAALCLTLRHLEGPQALEAFLQRFPGPGPADAPPPFRLTSAFPCAGDVLFFPKPLVPPRLEKPEEHPRTLKGVKFVSERIFVRWLRGEPLDDAMGEENFLHEGELWVTPDEGARLAPFREADGTVRLWTRGPERIVPRVTVDRVTSGSVVYQAGVVRFRRVRGPAGEVRAGLWVAVEWLQEPSAPERERLTTLLAVLGDSGLGGERSLGYGQFDLEGPQDRPDWGIPDSGARWLTLSPYHPRREEVANGVLGEGCAYTLVARRGWIASPEGMTLRRPMVRMLGEGSVLRHPADGPRPTYGDLADVTPKAMDPAGGNKGHKVWRYGIAFPVPVTMAAEGTG